MSAIKTHRKKVVNICQSVPRFSRGDRTSTRRCLFDAGEGGKVPNLLGPSFLSVIERLWHGNGIALCPVVDFTETVDWGGKAFLAGLDLQG
jgi:hypothetical protein